MNAYTVLYEIDPSGMKTVRLSSKDFAQLLDGKMLPQDKVKLLSEIAECLKEEIEQS